jgi:peptide/nickel transport system permease protein
LGGSVVVEAVFSYPGLGRTLYDAVLSRDYPLMQYIFLLIAVMELLSCLITDLLYPLLAPRVKT